MQRAINSVLVKVAKVAGSIPVVVGTAAAWGSAAVAFKGGRRSANRHKAQANFLAVVGAMLLGRARLGGASFTDVTSTAGIGGSSIGMAIADYDGDGDLDLYVVNYDTANVLYQNDDGGERESDEDDVSYPCALRQMRFEDLKNKGKVVQNDPSRVS